MDKKVTIKCVDNIIYNGTIEMNNDTVLVLKEVKCNNGNNQLLSPGIHINGEITFMWDKIIWATL